MGDLNKYNEEAEYIPQVKLKEIQCPHCRRPILLSENLDVQAVEATR
jgi:hypothetical protein